jgi:ParB/RepB/Spo0J family partition protein
MTATALAPAEPETETVVLLPVEQCHKSPTQPRRRGGDKLDADFVASIREKGVLQPIVVRKRKPAGWEIVFGHRRHAGAVKAERDAIPAIVRDMTDDDVFEAQLIENVHREDMHPLDEADGFKRMIDRGKTAQYIADKIGRPVTYIAQRLKLCELGKEVRAALDKEEISLGVAVLIARVPPSLQAEALRAIEAHYGDVSVAEAKRTLESTFLLRLDQAPFEVTDAQLVPKAGACVACPKRTGQQRELFPDAARADMCTDPVCYRGKLDAVWQIRKKEAVAGGTAVLEGKAAEKAVGYGGDYKRLDAQEWTGAKEVKIRSLFGKELPPVTLARDEKTGAIHELVKAADVEKVLKRNRPRAGGGDSYAAQNRRQQEKDRLRSAAISDAISQAIAGMSKLGAPGLIRLLTRVLVARTWDDSEKKIMARRGVEKVKNQGTRGALEAYLRTLSKPADVAGLGLELALWTVAPSRWGGKEREWDETLKATGVNFAAIEKKVAAEAKAKKTAKKSARKRAT